MSHKVSLTDFCAKYRLTTQTQDKLAALDYTPGNKLVESLSEADWKEAGLSASAKQPSSVQSLHRFVQWHRSHRKVPTITDSDKVVYTHLFCHILW